MFIIIKHGGKQYWAENGSVLSLEKVEGNPGDTIQLEVILSAEEGKLDLAKKTIEATILKHYKDDKVIVFKKKKRHHYERTLGHRQHLTNVKINATH